MYLIVYAEVKDLIKRLCNTLIVYVATTVVTFSLLINTSKSSFFAKQSTIEKIICV